jgi:hypothetical protein
MATPTTPTTLPVVQSYRLDLPTDPAEKAQVDDEVAYLFRHIMGRFPEGYIPPTVGHKPHKRKREAPPQADGAVAKAPPAEAPAAEAQQAPETKSITLI